MNTYIEVRPLSAVADGKELIQWSERDGWGHLYLYDDQGNLIRRLTEGTWHVHEILDVDEKHRTVYFTAMGREKGENPYYQHLYSVSLDGGDVKLLNKLDLSGAGDLSQLQRPQRCGEGVQGRAAEAEKGLVCRGLRPVALRAESY